MRANGRLPRTLFARKRAPTGWKIHPEVNPGGRVGTSYLPAGVREILGIKDMPTRRSPGIIRRASLHVFQLQPPVKHPLGFIDSQVFQR